jgi:hypothetical protein
VFADLKSLFSVQLGIRCDVFNILYLVLKLSL